MTETVYRRGRPEDWADIIDFANYVFSQNGAPHDFPRLIPKVYGGGPEMAALHHLALEEGRIKGMVAVYPSLCGIAGNRLKTGFIGTVSVHPYARGRGYMKRLMADAAERMREDGAALSMLGGQRQRYRYFGYELGGTVLLFHVNAANIRHVLGAAPEEAVRLTPAAAGDMDALYACYSRRWITGRSREEFPAVLRTWNAVPYTVREGGRLAGYLCASADGGCVLETGLDTPALLPRVLKAYLQIHGGGVEVRLAAFEQELAAALAPLCEAYTVVQDQQYRILEYPAVLEALLKLRAAVSPLSDGRFVLGVRGAGQYALSVSGGRPAAEAVGEAADIVLEETEAVPFLTSPLGLLRPRPACVPADWFPVPFALSPLDGF